MLKNMNVPFHALSIGILFLLGCLGCSGNSDNTTRTTITKDTVSTMPPRICDEPLPWTTQTTSILVGDGTQASCTEDALRKAVAGGGYIRFHCGVDDLTISIPKEIEVNQETIMDGEGHVTLDGGGITRIFQVNSTLSIRNLRFQNGAAKGKDENGGAVSGGWRSKLEVIGCIFENNSAMGSGGALSVGTGSELTVVGSRFLYNKSGYGGAIYSLWSPLHIVNSEFTENSTLNNGGGGAIGTDGALDPAYRAEETVGGVVEICGSVFQRNQASGAGGSAFIWVYPPDKIVIDRCTIQDNVLSKVDGGIAMGGGMRLSNGEITIKASSFLSNIAGTHGGALSLDCEPNCTITNSTFFNNQVLDGYGGAIFGNKLRVNNVTFANNLASGHGGALFGGEDWILQNSIFVDNKAGNPWGQAYSCASTGTGNNVLQWVGEFKGAGSDSCIPGAFVADPLIASPADNGGPTPTMLLSESSPALQKGTNCEPLDQRGNVRDTLACDLGAVELP